MPEDKQSKVQAAREKKKLHRKKDSKVSEIKSLINEVASLKRSISKTSSATVAFERGKEYEEKPPNDVENQYGGRNKSRRLTAPNEIHVVYTSV